MSVWVSGYHFSAEPTGAAKPGWTGFNGREAQGIVPLRSCSEFNGRVLVKELVYVLRS